MATGWPASRPLARVLGALVLFLGGCASVPQEYPRTVSHALQETVDSPLVRRLEQEALAHPDQSGFAIVRRGQNAFTARVAMTELARRSLDLQYYIWEGDETGWILAERLLRAADRGVRVRLLLDDINIKGRDLAIAALDAHPLIEIRLFNPFAYRGFNGLDFLTDFARVNHRMHNKLMLMDNALAVVGGRNIGNHYFEVATDANFRDLDIIAAGPVVPEISQVFDHFWNGVWSVPIAALVSPEQTETDLERTRKALARSIASRGYPYPLDTRIDALKAQLDDEIKALIWAPGQMIWDDPAELVATGQTHRVNEELYRRVAALEQELLVEAAYFVQRARGQAMLGALAERGVRVRVLTNSMASNDVLAAHAGYAATREALLDRGVELYELRPYPEPTHKKLFSPRSRAALHTKAMLFDRRVLFIGSFNLDARSAEINTEAGLLIDSPELAAQLRAYLDQGVSAEASYRVERNDAGALIWRTEQNGVRQRWQQEPETHFWQRWLVQVLGLLPLEDQL